MWRHVIASRMHVSSVSFHLQQQQQQHPVCLSQIPTLVAQSPSLTVYLTYQVIR